MSGTYSLLRSVLIGYREGQDDRCRTTPTTVIGNLHLDFVGVNKAVPSLANFRRLHACAPPVGCNSMQIWLQASCMTLATPEAQAHLAQAR